MARLSLTVRDRRKLGNLKATKSPRNPAGPFADLTWEQQRAAEQWLAKFFARWEGNLPGWRRAILIGNARKLAKYPPAVTFAKSLHGHYGAGLLVRKCRAAGIEHPRIVAMQKARFHALGPLPMRQLAI